MDKARDVKRGASRFGLAKRKRKPSALGVGGDVDSSERSKKERIRGPCFIDSEVLSNEDSEMSGESEGEEDVHRRPPPAGTGGNKRFKLRRKLLDDCHIVEPPAVPRKLRSAMSKCNLETISPISPDAKKLHIASSGIEAPQINGVKKSKQNMGQGRCLGLPPRRAVLGPIITKDEEEVVETLYALAKMFPNNNPDKSDKSKVDLETSEAKCSPLPGTRESSRLVCEAPNEENVKYICPSTAAEAINLSPSVEGSPKETVQVDSFTEPIIREPPYVKLDPESDSAVPRADQQVSLLLKSDHKNEIPLDVGVTQSKRKETLLCEREKENGIWPATTATVSPQEHHLIKASKEICTHLACVVGLSVAGSCGAGVQNPSLQSSAITYSGWMDAATCATKSGSAGNNISIKKDARCVADRKKSWKKCTAHVYISHLIRAYQIADKKDKLETLPNQLKLNDGRDTDVMAAENPIEVRNSSNEGISASSVNGCTTTKNSNEARISVIVDKNLRQDQQQDCSTSGFSLLQKQSCDFLSLSPACGDMEANCSRNSAGNGLEPLSQLHVPYLHSLMQHHPLMHLSPTHYPDRLTTTAAQQVQFQLPYAMNPFHDPCHLGQASSGKQQQQEQEQHHQMWRPQMAAVQYLSKWQNGRQHVSPSLFPCAQAIFHPSSASMEGFGVKFPPGTQQQQQQQLFALGSSLPHSSRGMKGQHHHHLPTGYDEAGVGLRSDGSSHLQLLCNAERS